MGRVFPESHLEKMRSLPQAHNSVRNVLPGCQSHPVPLHCYSPWLPGLGFSGATNTSDLHLCCPQRASSLRSRVILEALKAAPVPEGNFAPKGRWITGCQAAEGEMHTVQQTRYTSHAGLPPRATCRLLCSPQDTLEDLWAAGAALSTWKISAFYGNSFTNPATHSVGVLSHKLPSISWISGYIEFPESCTAIRAHRGICAIVLYQHFFHWCVVLCFSQNHFLLKIG